MTQQRLDIGVEEGNSKFVGEADAQGKIAGLS